MKAMRIDSQPDESGSIAPAVPGFASLMTAPAAPPGFSPLTTFTLQKVQSSTSDILQISVNKDSVKINGGSLKRSFQPKPWLCYKFGNLDEEAEDPEIVESDIPAIQCLPKGVFHGCSECSNCLTIRARWRPEDACRPVLDEAPAFYPTEEEFKDTLRYIANIRPKAEAYGMCRIIPPSSWKPPCPLKEKNVWVNSKFSTQKHKINMLQNRQSCKKRCSNLNAMKNKRRKLSESDEHRSNYDCSMGTKFLGFCSNFEFESGPDFTFESFEEHAKKFKEQYFQTRNGEPSPEEIEGEYWRIVEQPTEEIEVLYGSDLETGIFGSGFHQVSSLSNPEDVYLKSGWNLNNLPRFSGSLLAFEKGHISGITVPWLYVGMCFSSFCWHVEDHHLYSVNYLHQGAPKMWYAVPRDKALKFEKTLKKHLPDLFEEQPDLLHKLVTQFSPSLLKKEGVPVYRCLQNAGEFVVTFPRAYHSGFSCGFNCAEAVNVAPIDWLPHGQNAVEIYSQQHRRVNLSHDKLLLEVAKETVRSQWKIKFYGQKTIDNLRWKDECTVDEILAKSLKDRIKMEQLRREYLAPQQSQRMDADFDANCERECAICQYDLHLSAVFCSCSPNTYTCLTHSNGLCSCSWSSKVSLYRYEINELNLLLDALSDKPGAVYRWGLSHLGLTLGSSTKEKSSESSVSPEKTPELKLPAISSDVKDDQKKNNVIPKSALGLDLNDNEPALATSLPIPNIKTLLRCPRMTKMVQGNNFDVEVLEYGFARPGKLWSTGQAIFPEGFKSRARYFSILEPTQTCYYTSEILDGGLLGPLFTVSVEGCSSETFMHYSATKCWDLVRERVNSEIKKLHLLKNCSLPSLLPAGSVDGLEMFGLTSPSIIRDIEAIDEYHCCTEYWSSRSEAITSTRVSDENEKGVIEGILKKCNQEEIEALHRQLNNEDPNAIRELTDMIEQQITRNRKL